MLLFKSKKEKMTYGERVVSRHKSKLSKRLTRRVIMELGKLVKLARAGRITQKQLTYATFLISKLHPKSKEVKPILKAK